MTETALDIALDLAAAGYHLAPVTIRRNPMTGRKMPTYHGKWRELATTDPDVIRDWYAQHGPDVSFCIDCAASGLVVIDLDVKPDGSINAVHWWGTEGLPAGSMIVNTPTGGMHLYYKATSRRPVGNSTGAIAPGVDVRGDGGHVYAPGSRVIGDREAYVLQGAFVAAATLDEVPAEILERIPVDMRRPRERTEARANGAVHDHEWVERALRAQMDRIYSHPPTLGSGFRSVLMGAAMMYGRAVAAGIRDRDQAERLLLGAAATVWGGADDEDYAWIRCGLDDGEADPWTVVETEEESQRVRLLNEPLPSLLAQPANPEVPGMNVDGQAGGEDPSAVLFEREVLAEIRKLDIRETATRRRAERQRAERPSIESELIDVRDLESIPPPRMLMGELIPHAAVGFLAGKYGSYKSFIAVSWACSLASGRPWQARMEFHVPERVRVLYVAAEGAAGVAQRIIAWEKANTEIESGMLSVYPKPIKLNSAPDVEELAELVGRRGYGFVVIDTYHRSAPGTEENSSTEFGLVYEAMAGIRDAHGTTTLFVDHTGHSGTRVRGTSAKADDADFVMLSDMPGDERTPDAQRTLKVSKRKDLPTEGEWPVRLAPVGDSAVLELGTVDLAVSPFGDLHANWWEHDMFELPAAVVGLTGPGSDAAREIFRVLRFVDDEMTMAALLRAINGRPGGKTYSEPTARRGRILLEKAGVVCSPTAATRYALEAPYRPVS